MLLRKISTGWFLSLLLVMGIFPSFGEETVVRGLEKEGEWIIQRGLNAGPGSTTIDREHLRKGSYPRKFCYTHTEAKSFDFIEFTKEIPPTDFKDKVITLWLKQLEDPNASLSLRLYDSSGKYKEYYFPEGDGSWRYYEIGSSDLVWKADLSNIVKISFHSNGDSSSIPTSGCFWVDKMEISSSQKINKGKEKLRSEVKAWVDSLLSRKNIPLKGQKVRFVSWGGIGSEARAQAAAKIGIDTHRLPIAWPRREGGYSEETLKDLEKKIKWVHNAGMKVIIHFYNHGVPQWFWEKYPDAHCRNYKGETWEHVSFWHPEALRYIKRNMREVLDYLSQRGLLNKIDGVEIGIGMEGQLSYMWNSIWAFDKYTISAYRDFLKERYRGKIERLNQDWGKEYKDFSQILPPIDYKPDREHEVFQDFYRGTILRTALILGEVVKEKFSPRIWVWLTHNIKFPERYFAARYPVFYMKNLKKLGGERVAITSVVPGWQTKDDIEKLKKYATVIGEWYIIPTPAQQREQAKLAQKLGCDGFFVGVLENLFEADGTPTSVGLETAVIIKEWKEGKSLREKPIFGP